MRKRYRVLAFAALVAALVVPVGYALSIESTPVVLQSPHAAVPAATAVVPRSAAAVVTAPIVIRTSAPATTPVYPFKVPDAAKLIGIGAVLFGLAAAVRKAI
jgi:hypothetical protein